MKTPAMLIFRYLWANPHWRWWGKKVCMLAARYYKGIDCLDELGRERHGGGRYEDRVYPPYLTHVERKWIRLNECKIITEVLECEQQSSAEP